MPSQIWLIGGTTESVDLAAALSRCQLPCVVTVLSPSAQALYPALIGLKVCTGAFNYIKLRKFCHTHQIGVILDASHPYAIEISQLAMQASRQLQLPYLRFERSSAIISAAGRNPWIVEVDTLSQLLQGSYLQQQRVLLTVGSKWLPHFQEYHASSTLFVRVLPRSSALQAAVEAGFRCDRIIALRPPISFDLEKALWQHWQISVVVTKASGSPGGEEIKRRVAQALGVTLIIIKRPALAYPQQTSDLDTAIQFCRTALNAQEGMPSRDGQWP
ncbi:cobalt-precorrin-6A reductase [Acaryochloris sp. IP29b_bin.148]|uniref:cobalt-precorrin-6A reductase n=1 Tax=Acaryochloris sp. IP29b_bin.148 TaxID=2969218 RepID=UPI002601AE17|nr:cobalt-precorrin-6A reductase [Acaryochloris sp. IP29b_bin.148]